MGYQRIRGAFWGVRLDSIVCTYLLNFVCVLVELVEQEEEHHSVHSDPPDESFRVVAVDEQQLESVYHNQDELNLQPWRKIH